MNAGWISRKERFQLGFLTGLVAGILATLLMIWLSDVFHGVSLPDAVGSAIALAMPLSIFSFLHELIGGDAKHYLFYIVLVGQCFVFAVVAGLWALFVDTPWAHRLNLKSNQQGQLSLWGGLLLVALLWLATELLLFPLIGGGIFGVSLLVGAVDAMSSLALVGVVFVALFILLYNWLVAGSISRGKKFLDEEQLGRRRSLLRGALLVLGAGGLGWVAWRFVSGGMSTNSLPQSSVSSILKTFRSKVSPVPVPRYGTIVQVPDLTPEITTNDQFYQVSKNLSSDPVVDDASWSLTISGLVARPFSLKYDQLMTLPMKQQYETLTCISNEVGGDYMSNALWKGIPLMDLLQQAGGVKSGATKVVLSAADGYQDSIHLAKALEPTTLLALEMNNQMLPREHGYPARLLVPGIYGMKNVKWITGIQVVNYDFRGYWEQQGWDDEADIRMTARIDTPFDESHLSANRPTYVAGIAFSGNKGISEVDVSFDSGQTWKIATLKKPLSALTWVLWEIPWTPASGNYIITARAIDSEGNVQDPTVAPPAPDGSSGYDTITVQVI